MSFHERSAWLMSLAMLLGAGVYFDAVAEASAEAGTLVSPGIGVVVLYTVILVLVAIAGHILIAVLKPGEADPPLDERDQLVRLRAGNIAGWVLAVGVVCGMVFYLLAGNGDILFYTLFASLIGAQLVDYGLQILYYRTSP